MVFCGCCPFVAMHGLMGANGEDGGVGGVGGVLGVVGEDLGEPFLEVLGLRGDEM